MIKRIIRWEVNGTQYARGYILKATAGRLPTYAALVKEAKRGFSALT